MIQIYQEHPRYRMVPAYPEYHDYNTGNFGLLTKERERDLQRKCCIRVIIIQKGDCYQIRFAKNNWVRSWLVGQIDVEALDECTFNLMAEVIESQILPQINKTADDDIVVLVDVS